MSPVHTPAADSDSPTTASPGTNDAQMEEHPALRDVMIEDLVEAFAGGGWGWLDDARAFASPWGFDLGSVHIPVHLWHGEADEFVPVHQAEQLAGDLPNVTLTVRRDTGHMDLIANDFNTAIEAAGTTLTTTPLTPRCVHLRNRRPAHRPRRFER